MDGKKEGQSQRETRPVLLFVHDLDQEVRETLETGLEKLGVGIGVLDCHQEYASSRYDFNPRIIIASGSKAMQHARSAKAVIYAIPDINLFIPDNPEYKGLGKLVADLLKEIAIGVELQEEEEVPQPKGTVNIDPRDAVLPPPKDPLTLEEVKKIFQERFPEDPYVFSSNGVQVGVYLNDPPGTMPIEFSLEEFYTILKLVEVTRAKTIRWRTLDREEKDAGSE
jgi:hypothetical protein